MDPQFPHCLAPPPLPVMNVLPLRGWPVPPALYPRLGQSGGGGMGTDSRTKTGLYGAVYLM